MDQNFQQQLTAAMKHLHRNDPALRPIIDVTGLAHFEPHGDYYGALVNSIIGQQLSVKAATAIKQRFRDLFDGTMPSPEQIVSKTVEDLRAIGFSNSKARYVQDLAQHILDGRLSFTDIPKLSNDEIMGLLIDIKGIGEWTIHMFLMFCVGRLDVLPVGDLGIRNGVRKLYGLEDAPSPEQIKIIADQHSWHPYETVASWYIWRSLDNEPA